MIKDLKKDEDKLEAKKPADVSLEFSKVAEDTTAVVAEGEPTPKVVKKKKIKRHVPIGQVHIRATFNNTIISVTDNSGNLVSSSSAGSCGFRGSKKGTAYAAQVASDKAVSSAKVFGLSKADVYVKGIGLGRDAAIRAVNANGVSVESIKDVTGIPHGGCRPKKARRV
jgi:small subunit ribosomal protein S11